MSKGHMPGSMDLLLDTMCNTFGGVVFIALSLSLAFFISRSQSSPADNLAKITQELKEQQEKYLILEAERNSLTQKLISLTAFSSRYNQTETDLPELVTRLEQNYKDLRREAEIRKTAMADLDFKMKKLKAENRKAESEIHEKSRHTAEKSKTLTDEFERVCFLIDKLSERLLQTPAKKFHFAHNERTSRLPYVLLVKNNRLYRLGMKYTESSREISVKTSGNMVFLTAVGGTLLSSISSSDLQSVFRDYNEATSFLWIMVHPDSFDSFVGFRRLLRNAKFSVYWYIDTASILYLSNNPDYHYSY